MNNKKDLLAVRAEEKRGINVSDEFIDYAAPSNRAFGDEGLLIKAKQGKDDFKRAGVDPTILRLNKRHTFLSIYLSFTRGKLFP